MLTTTRDQFRAEYVNLTILDDRNEPPLTQHFLTYPLSWISKYVSHFYSEADPVIRMDIRSIGILDWSDLHRDRAAQRLFSEFTAHGLGNHAITIVDLAERHLHAALTLTFNVADETWPDFRTRHIDMMRFQANRIGEAFDRLYREGRRQSYHVTPREAECLYWVAMGKTDDQIGELLKIGRWTVNGHLQSAKEKLGTPTRAATVAKALVQGIISIRSAG